MKYIFTTLLFFILTCPFVKAQDTIVLNSGKRIVAKRVHIRQKIYYTYFSGKYRRDDSVNKSDVNYVVRESGWKIPMIPPPWYMPIIITPAIGISTMPYLFKSFLGDSGASIKSWSPVYSLTIDYASNPNYSLGIGFAWQSVKLNPYLSYNGSSSSNNFNPLFPNVNIHPSPTISGLYGGGTDNLITESLTRFNVGLRLLYHIRNDDEENFYVGARAGISFWTDKSTPTGYNSLTNLVAPSIQLIIGMRREINSFMGINLEGGIGTPYLANAGVYFKVNTVKK